LVTFTSIFCKLWFQFGPIWPCFA